MTISTRSATPGKKASMFYVDRIINKGTCEEYRRSMGYVRRIGDDDSGNWVWVHHTGRESGSVHPSRAAALKGLKLYIKRVDPVV